MDSATPLSRPPPRDAGGCDARSLPARVGIGLKPGHFRQLVETWPELGFLEIHAENYLVAGGPLHHYLSRVRERYPLSIHGVGLSLGGESALDADHLDQLAQLVERYAPQSFSEHLAWCGEGGIFVNDLLPLPYTPTRLRRVCEHVDQVQSRLRRRMLLENPATYVEFHESVLPETEFISEVVRRTGCGLLLDVNNIHVSCCNHQWDADAYLDALPAAAVGEIHLAGFALDHDAAGDVLLIDHHGSAVAPEVWRLYLRALDRVGPVATLIERDNHVPPLDELLAEAAIAAAMLAAHASAKQTM